MIAVDPKTTARVCAAALLCVLSVSLIASLAFTAPWLWMDEVLSYTLISDPALAHAHRAVVGGMDANAALDSSLNRFTKRPDSIFTLKLHRRLHPGV